jgi:mRNA deadenylase 3'-5' endonuclease subunit Ccr4
MSNLQTLINDIVKSVGREGEGYRVIVIDKRVCLQFKGPDCAEMPEGYPLLAVIKEVEGNLTVDLEGYAMKVTDADDEASLAIMTLSSDIEYEQKGLFRFDEHVREHNVGLHQRITEANNLLSRLKAEMQIQKESQMFLRHLDNLVADSNEPVLLELAEELRTKRKEL